MNPQVATLQHHAGNKLLHIVEILGSWPETIVVTSQKSSATRLEQLVSSLLET
jgi:hypothetical protein